VAGGISKGKGSAPPGKRRTDRRGGRKKAEKKVRERFAGKEAKK